MKRRDFLTLAGTAAAGTFVRSAVGAMARPGGKRPNILFLTVDDMNCDSIGVFGCPVKGTSPHTDHLAGQGMRFQYAHVQVANCMPSRNVLHSGLYSHSNGVEGFYQVQTDIPILPGVLKANGYFVGIKGKVGHSTPYHPWAWDLAEQKLERRGATRSPKSFSDFITNAVAQARAANKPFYLNVNATDPHKPFFGEEKSKAMGYDDFPPSRLFAVKDIPIPKFLPDLPVVRTEVKQYYDCVRRADDCVGETLKALAESGEADNTVVMFLSDHGMPFPFAKTNVYHHSTRTPWIVRWPGKVKAGSVDRQHMISAVDFMPTVLDIVGIEHPPGLQGKSFLPVLLGKTQAGRDYVIKEYNENSGRMRHPMRCVETRKYCYIFNPWADGERRFRTATQGTRTYKRMVELAPTDKKIAARLRLFDYRVLEELYDIENDPDSLRNLIQSPKHQAELDKLRKILEDWMIRTKDPCLEAFRNRGNPEALKAYMLKQDELGKSHRAKPKGGGKGGGSKRKGLLTLTVPKSASRGRSVTISVGHKLSKELGEQLVHVTIKEVGNKQRIDRKIVKAVGTGSLEVTFNVPDSAELETLVFAAFVGKDYPTCLDHVVSKPVPVK